MKQILFSVALFFLTVHVQSQSVISIEGSVSGVIGADTIKVIGNLFVPAEAELTISAGSIVKFMGYYSIDVRGSMVARGNSNDSILFTVQDTTGFHDTVQARGGWNRIVVNRQRSTEDSIIFEYCKFEYSKADSSQKDGGALFFKQETKIRISHCTFHKNMAARNGGAIYLNGASATINNSTFIQNHGGTYLVWGYGGCIYGMNAFASVNHCHFVENTSTGIGGAIAFDSVSPSVINSIFERNYSPLGGAIGILRAPTGGEIIGSLFNGNTSYFFGGALAIVGSSPKIVNNTIVNGLSMYGGGLYLYQGSHPTVANCIFWGNNTHAGYGRQVMILDSESSPKFQNSTFEHGAWDFQGTGYTGVYENCIELNPMFTSIGEHPFQLLANSPCINAGTPDVSGFNIPETDLAGNTRIYDTGIDMGGYEYQSIIGIQNPLSSDKKFTVNFNYKSQELMVTFNEGFNGNSVLNVIDVQGKSIFQTNLLSNGTAGEKIIIPCRALKTTGIYIAKVQSTGKEETQKFLVMAE